MAIQTQAKMIPVLDFSNLELKPGPEQVHGCQLAKMFAVHLKSTVAFVAELGNKIPLELHNTMFSSVGELFEFPMETKRKVTSERPFHGYFSTAPFERMLIDNPTSEEETHKLTNIFWPNGNDHVRESTNSLVKAEAFGGIGSNGDQFYH